MKKTRHLRACFAIFPILTLALIASCSGPNRIRPQGLAFAKIGAAMPADTLTRLDGKPLRDSTLEDNGYTWQARILACGEGEIWLESDFASPGKIGRIRVETPEMKVRKGLRVGSTAAELAQKSRHWEISPFQEYGLLEARSPDFPRVWFLLTAPGMDLNAASDEEIHIDSLSPESVVDKIVIM